MTIATTDGRATVFFDGPLEVTVDPHGRFDYPCEIWQDSRGRFVAIVTDVPTRIPSVDTARRGIIGALDAACLGYCDIIIEHWPDGFPGHGNFRLATDRGPDRTAEAAVAGSGLTLS